MAKNIEKIADRLGAKIVGAIPDVGGGAFGAARLARIHEALQARLIPQQGRKAEEKDPLKPAKARRIVRDASSAPGDSQATQVPQPKERKEPRGVGGRRSGNGLR
jgi:hypothetical protein